MSFFSFIHVLLCPWCPNLVNFLYLFFSNPFITLYTAIRSPLSLLCSNVVKDNICSLSLYDSSLKFGESFVAALCILSSSLKCFVLLGGHPVGTYSNLGRTSHYRFLNHIFIHISNSHLYIF